MSNLKLNIAAIIFAIFALTSCQKETMSELNPTTAITTQRDISAEGISMYHPDAKTAATAQTMRNSATSRERNFTTISADAGPIFDDTKGEGNFIDKSFGACLADYPWDFKGEDNVYIFEVKDQPEALVTHHVTISDLTNDVDLFVYTLDENNYVRDCKAISMNGGATAESVDMQGLEAGFYIIVVDGWAAGVTSTYNMEFYTTAIGANPATLNAVDTLTKINYGAIYEDGSSHDIGFFEVIGEILNDDNTSSVSFREHNVEGDLPHFGENTENDYYFVKVDSDEWSVYLRDESRGVNIQLDLYRMKVVYSDDAGNAFDLYDITYAY